MGNPWSLAVYGRIGGGEGSTKSRQVQTGGQPNVDVHTERGKILYYATDEMLKKLHAIFIILQYSGVCPRRLGGTAKSGQVLTGGRGSKK